MRAFATVGLWLLLGVGSIATLACGSGGGAATPPTPAPIALFNGTYFYLSCGGDFSVPSLTSWWGEVGADGAGQITGGTLDWNDGVAAIGSGPVPPLAYAVDAARRMTWPTGGPLNMQGGIAVDGRAAVLGSIGAGGWPTATVLVRKGGTFGPGGLTGPYHLGGMYQAPGNEYAEWGTVTFAGPGTANETIMENQNGVLLGPWVTAQSYALAADGSMTYDFTPGVVPTRGGVLAGGDLVVLGGGTTTLFPRVLVVLIRQSAAASIATLSGRYHVVGFSFVPPIGPPPHFNSFTGTADADGAGTLSLHVGGTINADGVAAPFPPAPTNDTYTVAPNGALTLVTSLTTLKGGVSPGGEFAVLAGGETAASLPQLWILVR